MGIESRDISSYLISVVKAQAKLEEEAARKVASARSIAVRVSEIEARLLLFGGTSGFGLSTNAMENGALDWQKRTYAVREMNLISTEDSGLDFVTGTTPTGEHILLISSRNGRRRRDVSGTLGNALLNGRVAGKLFKRYAGPLERRHALMQGAKPSQK